MLPRVIQVILKEILKSALITQYYLHKNATSHNGAGFVYAEHKQL